MQGEERPPKHDGRRQIVFHKKGLMGVFRSPPYVDSLQTYAILKLFWYMETRTLTQWDLGFILSDSDSQCRSCRPHFTF
jgi:hypothetical protein